MYLCNTETETHRNKYTEIHSSEIQLIGSHHGLSPLSHSDIYGTYRSTFGNFPCVIGVRLLSLLNQKIEECSCLCYTLRKVAH